MESQRPEKLSGCSKNSGNHSPCHVIGQLFLSWDWIIGNLTKSSALKKWFRVHTALLDWLRECRGILVWGPPASEVISLDIGVQNFYYPKTLHTLPLPAPLLPHLLLPPLSPLPDIYTSLLAFPQIYLAVPPQDLDSCCMSPWILSGICSNVVFCAHCSWGPHHTSSGTLGPSHWTAFYRHSLLSL